MIFCSFSREREIVISRSEVDTFSSVGNEKRDMSDSRAERQQILDPLKEPHLGSKTFGCAT